MAFARGALSLWVAGHFADDADRPLHRHVKALEQALRRLADELTTHAPPETRVPRGSGSRLRGRCR